MNPTRVVWPLVIAALVGPQGESARAASRPNIVLIMADDLGYGDLGCYGQSEIATPNIDRLAATGLRFETCYAGSPVCAPARDAILTGRHSGHLTRRGNRPSVGAKSMYQRPVVPLRADDVTVAKLLQQAGYATGGFGKWGLGLPGSTGQPNLHGFDLWFGYLDQIHAHNYYTDHLFRVDSEGVHRVELAANAGGRRNEYSADVIHQASLQFIREHKGRPFFLYLATTLPHGRYEVPDATEYSQRKWTKAEKTFAAMVSHLDRQVGEVLNELDRMSLDQNTIVLFTSDHGPTNRFREKFSSTLGQRGHKRQLFEGGIRVPLIARWPQRITPGNVSDFVCWHPDMLPTIVAIADAKMPDTNVDGQSLLPSFEGETTKMERAFYFEFHDPFHQAVRLRNWKAIRWGTGEPMELYDLSSDLLEKSDVASHHPAVVEEARSIMDNDRTDNPYWPLRAYRRGGDKLSRSESRSVR